MYETIQEFKVKEGYTVNFLCKVLQIPRSSYYKWLNRIIPNKELQDEEVARLIIEYNETFNRVLGYRQMTYYINYLNHTNYSEGYIHRLMKFLHIKARIRLKKINRVICKPEQIGENILSREFTADYPNQKWCTDVTEFKIPGENRKLYLSAILDLYDRSIVAYELSNSNNNKLVFDTFHKAMDANPYAKPIFHSDRGFQYTSKMFKFLLDQNGLIQSMSRVGKCIDNGPMEGFWGTLKSEMFYGIHFKDESALREKIQNYIFDYNNWRLQKKLGTTPNQYRYYSQLPRIVV